MKNRELVAMVRSQLKQLSGDSLMSDRALLFDLRSTANLLIKRETDKRRLFTIDSLFTTLNCLEMVEVPLAECCAYRSPCNIRRSKEKIPKIGEGIWGYIVQGVFSIDGSKRFLEGTPQKFVNAKDLNIKNLPNFFWLQNGYLYISNPNIEMIKVKAYFEEDVPPTINVCDPERDKDLPCKNPLDNDFKCPGYLIQNVLDIVLQKYMQTNQSKDDSQDNDKED